MNDVTSLTHLDYADEAGSASRAGAWLQAAALWRRAAALCPDGATRDRYLRSAERCERNATAF